MALAIKKVIRFSILTENKERYLKNKKIHKKCNKIREFLEKNMYFDLKMEKYESYGVSNSSN